jgi:hypothetical protein
MAWRKLSPNAPKALFLVSTIAILSISKAMQLSFGTLSQSKTVPTSGSVDYNSAKILTSFMEDWFSNASRAIEVAKKSDALITWCGDFIPEMRGANPHLLLLRYIPICGVYNNTSTWSQALAEGWLLKDPSGKYVHSTIWQTLYVCDPNNLQYRNWLSNECKLILDQYDFDGIFGDGASAVTRPLWDISGDPINPATGAIYTDHDWSIALVGLNQMIKQKIGSKIYIGNGCMCGSGEYGAWAHFADYQELYGTLDGAMIETSVFAYWGGFRSEQQWTQDIDFIRWHTSQGKITLLWSYVDNTSAADSEAEYCYCSYLLGIESFNNSFTYAGSTWDLRGLDMGKPLGDYYKILQTSVYARDFVKGKVLVNPTDVAYTVSLDKSYITFDGNPVASTLIVNPHTGVILLQT